MTGAYVNIAVYGTKIRFLKNPFSELKSQVHSKSVDFDNLSVKAAACGRTLAVTEQELRLVAVYVLNVQIGPPVLMACRKKES